MFDIIFGKIKSIALLVSIIITIFTSSYSMYYKIKADKLQIERDNVTDELVVKTKEVTHYKNKLGQEVTKTIEMRKSLKDMRNSNDSIEILFVKTLDASKVREKEVKSLLYVNSELNDKIDRDTNYIVQKPIIKDSVVFPLHFKNEYSEATVYADSIKLKVITDIVVVSAKRRVIREWWLWNKLGFMKTIDRDMVEVTSSNPMITIKTRKTKIIK